MGVKLLIHEKGNGGGHSFYLIAQNLLRKNDVKTSNGDNMRYINKGASHLLYIQSLEKTWIPNQF